MLKDFHVFSSFSVNNLEIAKKFYADTLGLKVEETPEGLSMKLTGGHDIFIYPKEDHEPATFTVLNFIVSDIDAAIDELRQKDIEFEQQDFGFAKTDDKGVMRGKDAGKGPNIAWFKDPAGNTLSLLET